MDYFSSRKDYQNDYKNNKDKIYKITNKKYSKDIMKFFPSKDIKILEIGFWNWKFANFLFQNWYKEYTWIDVDDFYIRDLKETFPEYHFYKSNIHEFLMPNKNKYDIIFMSHVFEHLNKSERETCIKCIETSLKKNWYRINYMPNADSDILLWYGRRWDITHYTIYNSISFEQLLNKYSNFSEINHYNQYVWFQNPIYRIFHKITLFFTKIYYLGMWSHLPKIYTWEFLSIIKK